MVCFGWFSAWIIWTLGTVCGGAFIIYMFKRSNKDIPEKEIKKSG